MTPLLAAVAAAGAAAVWWPPRRPGPRSGLVAPFVIGAVLASVVALWSRWMVPVIVGTAVGAAGVLLWRAGKRHRRRLATARLVLEVCEQLAAELSAGLPTGAALEKAASVWAPFARAAEAQRMGADVPSAMRSLAEHHPGAKELRLLAGAWHVAHRTGQGLTASVDRVAAELRAADATRRVVDGELASARATARLMAVLPVLALTMGSGVGGDPWAFLLHHPIGWGCLAAGGLCAVAGLWWIEALARSVGVPR